MARRKTIPDPLREALNAIPVASPDVAEERHFYTCIECGQRVDMRLLGDVLHHEDPGHEPIAFDDAVPAPKFIAPMLPTLVDGAPDGDGWSHEIKYDGYRTQIHVRDGKARAFTRNGHDWSDRYQPLLEAAVKLPCESAIIDGEVVIQHEGGQCDFHGLREAIQHQPHRLVFMGFDLLEVDGQDLRKRPLERRRELLNKLIGRNDPACPIQYSAEVIGSGKAFFMVVEGMGLEGIVSKRLGSTYRSGRADAWLKTKCFMEEDLVVIGTEPGKAAPVALLAREVDGGLQYVGGAMVTLPAAERDRFWRAVEALSVPKPVVPMGKRKANWVRPEISVRVRTLRGEEKLRHATIRAMIAAPAHHDDR